MITKPKRRRFKTRFAAFVAGSVDGRISLEKRARPDWTSKEDWNFLQNSLKRFDAVVVGRNTYLAAKANLKKRNTYVLSRTLSSLKKEGSVTFVNPQKTDLRKLLAAHRNIAVLGAGEVYQYMLDRGMLNELFVTVEPLIFGRGNTMFSGGRKNRKLMLRAVRRLNKKGTLLLHYDIARS